MDNEIAGEAVMWAMTTGRCISCPHYQPCRTKAGYQRPYDAHCIRREREFYEGKKPNDQENRDGAHRPV